MRRWIATTTVMLTMLPMLSGPATVAHAGLAPADPVEALKRQLVANHGVRMTNVHTTTLEGEKLKFWEKGVAEFGKGKIIATDITYDSEMRTTPTRLITFDGRQFRKDKKGKIKSWVVSTYKDTKPELDVSWLKIADPAVLKAVLATTRVKRPAGRYDGTRTTLYQGTITWGQLVKAGAEFPFNISRNWKPTEKEAQIKVEWRLWLGTDQLLRRAVGWFSRKTSDGDGPYTYVHDTRVTGWGSTIHVTPPPADEVITEKEANDILAKEYGFRE